MDTKKFYEEPKIVVTMMKMEGALLSNTNPNNEEGQDEEPF